MANGELTNHLAMVSNKQVSLLTSEFNRISIGADAVPDISPTSVLPLQPLNENQLLQQAAERRAVLPKSISIRSSGYLKMNQPSPKGPASQVPDQIRGTSPVRPVSVSSKLKLHHLIFLFITCFFFLILGNYGLNWYRYS
jgi:hypothetical protein